MNFPRIKHSLMRLSPEERVTGAGAILVLIASFMPWHSVVMSFDKQSITENGFSGDLGIIGFVVFLMTLIALLILVGENLHIRIPQFGYSKEQVLFFLMGQSSFLVLLTMAIYTKRSLEFTDAELRFGIFIALLGAFFGAAAAFSQSQKIEEKQTKSFFGYPEEDKPEKEEAEEAEEGTMSEKEKEIPEESAEEAPALFKEEGQPPPEDDMIEEIEVVEKKPTPPSHHTPPSSQADYFTREAGLRDRQD